MCADNVSASRGIVIGAGTTNVPTIVGSVAQPSRKYRLTVTWANGHTHTIEIRWKDRQGSLPPAIRVSCIDPNVSVAFSCGAFPGCPVYLTEPGKYRATIHLLLPPQDANRMIGIEGDDIYYVGGNTHKAVDRVWSVPQWIVPASLTTV